MSKMPTLVRLLVATAMLACLLDAKKYANEEITRGYNREYVDEDTPESDRVWKKQQSREGVYNLVFSDEFNEPNRRFFDGEDPRWTAIDLVPSTTDQRNIYSPDNAYTYNGTLRLRSEPLTGGDLPYKSAMVQTWNKFCFVEGILEIRAKMPGPHDTGGLWPAFWMMGNLGRATFKQSTEGIWPFTSGNTCPANEVDKEYAAIGLQRISQCDPLNEKYDMGGDARGSPEIDIIETMPGDKEQEYFSKIQSTQCTSPPISQDALDKLVIKRPMLATTLQFAPGIPKDTLERPKEGCLPIDPFVDWYPELYPFDKAFTNNVYGTDYETTMAYEFYGALFDGGMQVDAIGTDSVLPKEAFEDFYTYRLEWTEDRLIWYFNDSLLFNMSSKDLISNRTVYEFVQGEYINFAERRWPDEPMYLILNLDISDTWGWPFCETDETVKAWCDVDKVCCTDCQNPDCTECWIPDYPNGGWKNARSFMQNLCRVHEYEIDYVRLYQKEDRENIGCSPPNRRTNAWIEEHGRDFATLDMSEPLKAVKPGGGSCNADKDCGRSENSTCVSGKCNCYDMWTGPHCLVKAVGPSHYCHLWEQEYKAEFGGETCRSSEDIDYDDLKTTFDGTCLVLDNLGRSDICAPVKDWNSKYYDCSLRQKTDYALARYYDFSGGLRCCSNLGSEQYCESTIHQLRPLEPTVMVVLVIFGLLLVCKYTKRPIDETDEKYSPYRRLTMHKARLSVLGEEGGALLVRWRDWPKNIWVDRWISKQELPPAFVRAYGRAKAANPSNPLPLPPIKLNQKFYRKRDPIQIFPLEAKAKSPTGNVEDKQGLLVGSGGSSADDRKHGSTISLTVDRLLGKGKFSRAPSKQHIELKELRNPQGLNEASRGGGFRKTVWWIPLNSKLDIQTYGGDEQIIGSHSPASKFQSSAINATLSFDQLKSEEESSKGDSLSSKEHLVTENEEDLLLTPTTKFMAQGRVEEEKSWTRNIVAMAVHDIMMTLRRTFGFQIDSVKTQSYHILELWRSSIGDENTAHSRNQAVHKVHTRLLASYERWLGVIGEQRVNIGVNAMRSPSSGITMKKLQECCLYLCIWGESGNLRFMAELLCFIFHCARFHEKGVSFPDLDFLKHVVRPIYCHICSERYSTFKKNGRPKKRKNIEDFCNYDDWNELFWSADKIKTCIETYGTEMDDKNFIKATFTSIRLWNESISYRYTLLREVNWHKSLSFDNANTYREIHGWYGVTASYYRVVLLDAFAFSMQLNAEWPWELTLKEFSFVLSFPAVVLALGVSAKMYLTDGFWKGSRAEWAYYLFAVAPVFEFYTIRAVPYGEVEDVLRYIFIANACLSISFSLFGRSFGVFREIEKKLTGNYQVDDNIKYPRFKFVYGCVFWITVYIVKYILSRGLGFSVNISTPIVWRVNGPRTVITSIIRTSLLYATGFLAYFVQTTFLVSILTAIFGFIYGRILKLGTSLRAVYPCIFCLRQSRTDDKIPLRLMRKIYCEETRDQNVASESTKFHVAWNRIVLDLANNHQLSKQETSRLLLRKGAGFVQWLEIADQFRLLKIPEARRRLGFFARSLKSDLPKRVKAASMPSFCVLIPHYSDPMISAFHTLFSKEKPERASIKMNLLCKYFHEDAQILVSSLQKKAKQREFADIKMEVEKWASMREQTLWRTITGMLKYGDAIDLFLESEGFGEAQRKEMVQERFQVLVAMQIFTVLNKPGAEKRPEVQMILSLMKRHPWMEIAYLQDEPVEDPEDQFYANEKRYYSCLKSRRRDDCKILLPGQPVLGNGKGDNQNHALVFTIGRFIQAIDANQENYFEEAMKIGNVLQEFKDKPIALLGLREHIFSQSQGTMADFAGTSELVFGTLVQRVMSLQLVRLHYGHPDIMDKIYMMHQGGLSSATEGINLNEDIFSGMNLFLRGQDIGFKEYMQVGKARDMGFNSIMGFYEKLGRGGAEQTITRQHQRMGTRLPLHRLLSFYFGHLGFYLGHYFLSATIWLVAFMLLYYSLTDPEGEPPTYQSIARGVVSRLVGFLMILMMFATSLPAVAVLWSEEGLLPSLWRIFVVWQLTLAPLHFTFQSGIIAYAFGNTLLSGGTASYIATGRGLGVIHKKFEELYSRYSASNIIPGSEIFVFLLSSWFVWRADPLPILFWVAWSVIILSWTLAPYIFNPGQFDLERLPGMWIGFFTWLETDNSEKTAWRKQRMPKMVFDTQRLSTLILATLAFGWLCEERLGNDLYSWLVYLPWEPQVYLTITGLPNIICCHIGNVETAYAFIGTMMITCGVLLYVGLLQGLTTSTILIVIWYKTFTTQLSAELLAATGDFINDLNRIKNAPLIAKILKRPYMVVVFTGDLLVGTVLLCLVTGMSILLQPFICCGLHDYILFRSGKKDSPPVVEAKENRNPNIDPDNHIPGLQNYEADVKEGKMKEKDVLNAMRKLWSKQQVEN